MNLHQIKAMQIIRCLWRCVVFSHYIHNMLLAHNLALQVIFKNYISKLSLQTGPGLFKLKLVTEALFCPTLLLFYYIYSHMSD